MIGSCKQDLPEEGWSVFQVPIKLAKTLSTKDAVDLEEAYTSPLDTEGHNAPSEAIQMIANSWRSLSQITAQVRSDVSPSFLARKSSLYR